MVQWTSGFTFDIRVKFNDFFTDGGIPDIQGRTGQPGYLALPRWAGWSAVHVGRHVNC